MKFMILDGNSIINRAFYGVRPLSAPDGTRQMPFLDLSIFCSVWLIVDILMRWQLRSI